MIATASIEKTDRERFARCIQASKRVRWDIEDDVIRGRTFNLNERFLPDSLSKVEELALLKSDERRYVSQIQGRTYANVFGLVERFINAKILEVSRDHYLGDQTALEALVRFSDEELKHQEMFRRIDRLVGDQMQPGYRFVADPNEVARVVLSMGTWPVLVLTLHIELFTQLHYLESIEPNSDLSPLFKDVFLHHWKEESQHAIMDEIELRRIDRALTPSERDRGVGQFVDLVLSIDGILAEQASADAGYFATTCGRALDSAELEAVEAGLLRAYRWQYILSGAAQPHFVEVLTSLVTPEQGRYIQDALDVLA